MELSVLVSAVFKELLEKEIEREKAEDRYLPQEAFSSCRARAKALLAEAFEGAEDILTMAIAAHRSATHDEDHQGEIDFTQGKTKASEDRQFEAITAGFWAS